MSSFFNEDELRSKGFRCLGKNVLISKNATIYNVENISIGDDVRIDDFCILSGNITIGSNVHISAGSYLYGGIKGIVLEDFVNVSSRCAIYAISDDYVNSKYIGPMSFNEERVVIEKKVLLKKYSCVGTGSTILPGSILDEGTSVGAMSLVKGKLVPWTVYCGIPCKIIKQRKH